jgi:hypothetical protein
MVALLCTVGIVCCVAGIVGIWMFHQTASAKVENITARLDGGLQRASVANQNVQRALEQARASVGTVSKESTALGGGDEKSRRARSALRKLVRQQVGPNINNLGVQLTTFSDAAAAVSSLLQSFQELPLGQTGFIKLDKMEGWRAQTAQLATTLQRLENAVGDGNTQSSGQEIARASGAVDVALQKCQENVADWQSQLEAAREEVRYVNTKLLGWLSPTMIVLTLLCGWVALGQISLFTHALAWWKGA